MESPSPMCKLILSGDVFMQATGLAHVKDEKNLSILHNGTKTICNMQIVNPEN